MKRFENFGKEIRKIRESKGLTQEKFGEKIGAINQYVSNCERGQCALPKPVLKKLFKVLKVDGNTKHRVIEALIIDAAEQKRQELKGI